MVDSSGPRQNVTFASNGGQAHGYLATPASGSGPGLIVIQESTDLKTWTNKQTNNLPTNSDEEEYSIPTPVGGLPVPKDFYRAYIESFNSPPNH